MLWKHIIYRPLSDESDLEFILKQNTDGFNTILHQSIYVSPNEIVLIFGPAPCQLIQGINK